MADPSKAQSTPPPRKIERLAMLKEKTGSNWLMFGSWPLHYFLTKVRGFFVPWRPEDVDYSLQRGSSLNRFNKMLEAIHTEFPGYNSGAKGMFVSVATYEDRNEKVDLVRPKQGRSFIPLFRNSIDLSVAGCMIVCQVPEEAEELYIIYPLFDGKFHLLVDKRYHDDIVDMKMTGFIEPASMLSSHVKRITKYITRGFFLTTKPEEREVSPLENYCFSGFKPVTIIEELIPLRENKYFQAAMHLLNTYQIKDATDDLVDFEPIAIVEDMALAAMMLMHGKKMPEIDRGKMSAMIVWEEDSLERRKALFSRLTDATVYSTYAMWIYRMHMEMSWFDPVDDQGADFVTILAEKPIPIQCYITYSRAKPRDIYWAEQIGGGPMGVPLWLCATKKCVEAIETMGFVFKGESYYHASVWEGRGFTVTYEKKEEEETEKKEAAE